MTSRMLVHTTYPTKHSGAPASVARIQRWLRTKGSPKAIISHAIFTNQHTADASYVSC